MRMMVKPLGLKPQKNHQDTSLSAAFPLDLFMILVTLQYLWSYSELLLTLSCPVETFFAEV